jgi:RHH-type proline utilization regulon transcriptional repressor/proline dehydrogenase/delta 1-pyrroline-5-carboxylate dehydrogenase
MESYAQKNSTLDLFKRLFTEDGICRLARRRIVIQAICAMPSATCATWSTGAGGADAFRRPPREGAYWDYENYLVAEHLACPVFSRNRSDACFESCTRILLDNESIVTAAFGSHNVRSVAHAMA